MAIFTNPGGPRIALPAKDEGPKLVIYPNPSAYKAKLAFTAIKAGEVNGEVVSSDGQSVLKLNLGQRSPGQHNHEIDLRILPIGVYLINLQVDGRLISGKLLVAQE